MEHFEQVRKYHFIFMLAKQPSSRLFISLFHPFQSNYLLSLCWRNSLHLVSSFLCFILFSQTICNINQQLQNPKNRKIMSQFKKARKKCYERFLLHKISHLPRPQSFAVDCFGDLVTWATATKTYSSAQQLYTSITF